ncbi:MAG: Asp-tRNA(Asn)/Glu-tRNA(Gln) amidotransferase subunit GatC [Candidatus Peregrinibacteria bacterium]
MLSKDDVKKIARLARLHLSEDEIEKFSKQLSDILSYSKKLDEVDTSAVEPIAQITDLKNVTFTDETEDCEYRDALLKQSPQTVKDHMIQVKNVFE